MKKTIEQQELESLLEYLEEYEKSSEGSFIKKNDLLCWHSRQKKEHSIVTKLFEGKHISCDLETKSCSGKTLFRYLFPKSYDDCNPALSTLLKLGADINTQDKDGCTVWHRYPGLVDVQNSETSNRVKHKTEHKIDINKKDNDGVSVLASFLSFCPIRLRSVIENKDYYTPIDYTTQSKTGDSILMTIIKCRDGEDGLKIIEELCQHPQMLDLQDIHGNTALHCACYRNFPAVAKILLERGANYRIENKKGKCPMDYYLVRSITERVQKNSDRKKEYKNSDIALSILINLLKTMSLDQKQKQMVVAAQELLQLPIVKSEDYNRPIQVMANLCDKIILQYSNERSK